MHYRAGINRTYSKTGACWVYVRPATIGDCVCFRLARLASPGRVQSCCVCSRVVVPSRNWNVSPRRGHCNFHRYDLTIDREAGPVSCPESSNRFRPVTRARAAILHVPPLSSPTHFSRTYTCRPILSDLDPIALYVETRLLIPSNLSDSQRRVSWKYVARQIGARFSRQEQVHS